MVGDRCLAICVRIDGERPHRANGGTFRRQYSSAVPKIQADSVGAQASSDEPEQKQPTLEPNRGTAFADVENEGRFNELRRELLDDRSKMIDDRAKTLDWWLAATAIFLTFLAIVIPIAASYWRPFQF